MVCELYLNKVIKKRKIGRVWYWDLQKPLLPEIGKIRIPLPAAGNLLENEAFLAAHLL